VNLFRRRAATPAGLLGATPRTDGATEFRVWAPRASRVEVRLDDERHPLDPEPTGCFATTLAAGAGARYTFILDDDTSWPDPCSRAQPDGVRGDSAVVDHTAFEWTDAAWRGVALEDLVIYELHVGTFTDAGTFTGAIPYLAGLRELGVTAVELMPIATFPGTRGWGYDGLYTFAPHPAYGGPRDLATFVDAAHREGLGVIVDVVYNHVGPGSEALAAFGPYFTDRHHTFWGAAIDYTQVGAREWAIQNAEHWVREYHVDGLRLDATHAIFDESQPHVLRELADRVHSLRPGALVISEMETGDERPIRDWGHDAQWADELHHAVHVLVTGEHEGYYERYGSVADVARELERSEPHRLVVCAQNHDQVGNRAFGDRLRGRALRVAAFCCILSPGTPLLFMGEEHDEAQPFLFFTDHIDPDIAHATRDGRRREFAKFAAFAGEDVPDPQAYETYARSKLDRAAADDSHRRYYRTLLELRRRLHGYPARVVEVDEARRVLRVERGPVELVMNFSGQPYEEVPPLMGVVRGVDHLAG
jgi:maltooligosyltrehalose trehalohydrolase